MKRLIPIILALACFPALAQNLTQPITNPHVNLFDNSGNACAGCSLYTYAAGTTTPQATYTSASTSGGVNTNPIVLDAAGGAIIWTNFNAYKFVLKDASGNLLWTVDNVVSVASLGCLGANNIANGCTSATTSQGAATAIVDGNTIKPAVVANANVNGQYTVTEFGAKGDCTTDDHDAIQNALNEQLTSTPRVTVLFPPPPGGCYLTSTLTYTGASMQGQAGLGFIGNNGGVTIQGMPGQDILHITDPNTVGGVFPYDAGWTIRDITFRIDDSVDATSSFPHRWPGKWIQDGAINASSNQFTSTYAEFTCGDIGQNILVKGAGVSGADLSTTISAVSPCWHNNTGASPGETTALTVTLAANASTSVTNAYAYITPANIPVTLHIGNCGFAADNYDGNYADWHFQGGMYQPQLWNVTFSALTGSKTHGACGWYSSGTYSPYMMDAKNVWSYGPEWGIIQGMPDTNPGMSPGIGQDYQKWDHGWLFAVYPWISYNNGELTFTDYQITAPNGPQILQVQATNEGYPAGWYIHVPETETVSNAGWRIEGYSSTIVQTELCGGGTATIDTVGSRFINSACSGYLNLNGENNWLEGDVIGGTIVNKGMDNIVDGSYGNTNSGMLPTTVMTQTLNRGRQAFGVLTPDFVRNGTAPYYSDHDLFIWPQDFTDAYGYHFSVVQDGGSWTGNYVAIPASGYDLFYFNNMYMMGRTSTNQILAGTNIPAGPVVVSFSAKCPVITSFTAEIKAIGGSPATLSTLSASCSSSYQTFTMPVADFTSYSGYALDLYLSTGEVDIAWMVPLPLGTNSGSTSGSNANGYWVKDPTGTITERGSITVSAGTNVASGTITFPLTFPTALDSVVTTPGATPGGGSSTDAFMAYTTGASTSGATVVARCAVNIGGSGCSTISSAPIYWIAIGR